MKTFQRSYLWLALAVPVAAYFYNPTILEIAKKNGFTTLVTALEIAHLDGALDRPTLFFKFTAFAPTNAAFAALPSGLVTKLTTDANYSEFLKQLLEFHLVPKRVTSSSIKNGTKLQTVQGEYITFTKSSGGTITAVNGNATITTADLKASNGIVHAVNNVLVPKFLINDVVTLAASRKDLTTLVKAVSAVSGLVNVLKGGTFTIFAPTNAAFAKLGNSTLNALLADPNGKLATILKYHVVPGIVTADKLKNGNITTVAGSAISVKIVKVLLIFKYVRLNGKSIVIETNKLASNGVIHLIDTVLTPP